MSPLTLSKSSSSVRRQVARPVVARPATEKALRDIAFVLHLTQKVKADITQRAGR